MLVISKYFYHWSDTDESTTGGGANNSSSDNQTSSYTGMSNLIYLQLQYNLIFALALFSNIIYRQKEGKICLQMIL